ncbi:hypothetical protein BS78_07G026800 [Paspalum vaginatum]|nr:hypothetical protein BS78_07G026800 [Paspalum vaginatum]
MISASHRITLGSETTTPMHRRQQTRGEMPPISPIWRVFTPLVDEHGEYVYKAKCNYCPADNKVFETNDGCRGNAVLWKHFKRCHPQHAYVLHRATSAAQCGELVSLLCVGWSLSEPRRRRRRSLVVPSRT